MAYGSHCRRPVCDLDRDLIIVPLKHRSAQVRSSMHFLWPACSIVVRAMAGAVPRDHCGRGRDAAVVEAEIEVREIAEAWNGGLARPLEGTSRNLTRSDDYDRNGLDSRSSYGLGAPPARGAAPSFGAPPARGAAAPSFGAPPARGAAPGLGAPPARGAAPGLGTPPSRGAAPSFGAPPAR